MANPLSSVMSMFSSAPNPAPVAPAPTPANLNPVVPPGTTIPNTPTIPVQTTEVTPANGIIPQQPVAPINKVPDSPIDEFKSLWEDVPIDPNAPKDTSPAPVALNQQDVAKAMSKADFSSAVTPETLEAITAGGEGAAVALVQALNAVAQQSMTQTVMITEKLATKNLEAALARQAQDLPAQIRSQSNSAHLTDTNPLFNSPAIAPVIDATRSQLEVKFPAATPAEITKMTQDYIVAMGGLFAPKPDNPATPAGSTDWDKFLQG